MKPVYSVLDTLRAFVRGGMEKFAKSLNRSTGGKLHPNVITIVGLLAHAPIAWLIATHNFILGAILLIIFGLFDTLDGSLARLQKRASNAGMLLDATTDRMKEVILYMGVGTAITFPRTEITAWTSEGFSRTVYGPDIGAQYLLMTAIAACGGSLLVSYVKAKGETAVAGKGLSANEVNRLFQDGLARFEVRMFILVVGLLTQTLFFAVLLVAILSWITAFDRLIKISRALK